MPDSENLAPSIAGAMVLAARKLGLEGTFLRMVAAELPDESLLPAYTLTRDGDGAVITRVGHCCVPGCPAQPRSCLTALKVEQVVSRDLGQPYRVESARLEGEDLQLRLRPFD